MVKLMNLLHFSFGNGFGNGNGKPNNFKHSSGNVPNGNVGMGTTFVDFINKIVLAFPKPFPIFILIKSNTWIFISISFPINMVAFPKIAFPVTKLSNYCFYYILTLF